ncbi:hypothetical protein [Jiangella mangrovi]|uniref:Uncharacterized protein n=1 Tax=Jiangella mangrovi TaxID=1524084 RepID=A0A7W9GL17_9ACTN|nr:hypothetical protein [Jiangella mangrovi]MBB5785808.1 hypothetical protein [Jiangella mangrovi]
MTFEDQIELEMRAEALQIDPPVAGLVAGGLARGQELRRRHRARIAVGGAALVVVAGAGTVLAVPLLSGDDGGSGHDSPVAGSPAVPVQADPTREIDPDAVLDAVVALLPPGEITEANASSLESNSAWVDFVWDDGSGASWVSGSVSMETEPDPGCPVILNGGTCEVEALGDGTTLRLEAGPYYPQPDREPDRLQAHATAVSPDGLTVYLAVMNTPTEKQSEPTRAEPPFSTDQLAGVVTDGVWAELTAGVEPPAPPEDPGPQETSEAAQVLADELGAGWTPGLGETAEAGPAVTSLLPSGIVVTANLMEFGPELSMAEHCVAMEEKGRITQPCTTTTGLDGQTVHLQRASNALDGPYAVRGYGTDLMVMTGTDDRWIRVTLSVSDTEDTTAERRERIEAWLEDQVDAVVRAAKAGLTVEVG